jgi:predicted DCC family thiol-disulfide oxidoreductase YuxK
MNGYLLYDDSCGFCRRWVPFWESTLRKRGFLIAPLQTKWVMEKLELPPEELLFDLRLLLENGAQIHGADAYRYLMRRIWWTFPIYLLSVTPLLRGLFNLSYRSFADNRYWFSHACRLPPTPEAEDGSPDDMDAGVGK